MTERDFSAVASLLVFGVVAVGIGAHLQWGDGAAWFCVGTYVTVVALALLLAHRKDQVK